MRVLFSIVVILALGGEAGHRGVSGEENEVGSEGIGSASAPSFAVEMPRSVKSGDDSDPGKGEKPPTENKVLKPSALDARGGYPLFIFAQDRAVSTDFGHEEAVSLVNELKAMVKLKVSGAQILEVTALTADDLADAYAKPGSRKVGTRASIDTALLIVNAPAKWNEEKGLILRGQKGDLPQKSWEEAISKLSRSIFGVGMEGRLETVLLTDFSGYAECNKLPGPLFGMTPAGLPRDLAALALWVRLHRERRELPFPLTARQWYESWGMTNKVSRRRFFYCPVPNVKGYLGYKAASDPVNDNAGFEWDINDR